MITRLLPPEEWARLEGTDLGVLVTRGLLPQDTHVLVVEDDGAIVGAWSLMPLWHAEGVWVHPDHRGKTAVPRRLMAGMRAEAATLGASVVLTASLDDSISRLLTHLGALELPGRHFSFATEPICQP